ncbi:MAG: hypothetical protein QOD61_630 [Solirubrobacteraceae bacterium]|nr:hypothetical protein [Solirubrobacteraceae bacterium]
MKRVVASIVTVGVGLWAALPASADTAPAGTLTAQPGGAGAGTHLVVDAKGTGAGFGGAFPLGVTLALYKGYSLDLAAAGRCSDAAASAGACPASSQIATGLATGTASLAGLFSQAVSAPVGVFLANPSNGDLADVVVEVVVQGTTETARGQLVAVSDPTFGYEFRFDPLPAVAVPAGLAVTLGEFKLDVGASATGPAPAPKPAPKLKKCKKGYHHNSKHKCVKNKKKKKPVKKKAASLVTASAAATVTHNLITNPTTCAGSWPAQLRVRYADHTQTLDAAIVCSP